MLQNKIVVHYQDGRVMKGFTNDFTPSKSFLHLLPMNASPDSQPFPVSVPDLKAVFFVKDFTGNPQYREIKDFEPKKPVSGKKIKVIFKDGELLVGTTQGYQPDRPGFFVFPVDPKSNNDRCYVVAPATKGVWFI
jgi:hypothetical protein